MKHIFALEELKEVLDVRAYTMLDMFWCNFFTEVSAENGIITLSVEGSYEESIYDFVMNETLTSFIEVEGLDIKGSMENIEITLNNLYYELVANYVRRCMSIEFIQDYTRIDLYEECKLYGISRLDTVLFDYFDNCYEITQNVDFSNFSDYDDYFIFNSDTNECISYDDDSKLELFRDWIDENMYEH